ncbi:hypothetical protein BB559_003643 [Furculomyces boomerangus]|uniref:Uncharacterized protein n=1 Tax=Furculomyces boomerangus TaxID=61424 RepID=A0A2T9YEP5_9FUNG|nr:hypothetical protein BB559_004460 [Furculomyces boomerangus]PVU92642.1 hypothetical protein BB559_003643 [Furculomyces boomerangus]
MGAQQSKEQMVFYGADVPVKISNDALQAVEPTIEAPKTEEIPSQLQVDQDSINERIESEVAKELSRYFTKRQQEFEESKDRFWSTNELILCFNNNKERPLDCWRAVDNFFEATKKAEKIRASLP